ncbi:30S ribosomal protein S6 [Patescibacteria group bacterium]
MKEESKIYQLACHLSPLLDQGQIEKTVQKIKEIITADNGLFLDNKGLSIDNIQRKKLSYPIENYNESFYLVCDFLADGKNISEINNQINLKKDVIRHMITSRQKPKIVSKEIIDYKASKQIESLSLSKDSKDKATNNNEDIKDKKIPTSYKKDKIKIEELDKKLEEILNQ